MALLFMEGFDQYTIADEATMARGGWWGNVSLADPNVIIQTGTRHATAPGKQLQLNATNQDLFHQLPQTSDFTIGMAYKQVAANDDALFAFLDGTNVQIQVITRSDGEIRLTRGGTELETTSGLGLVNGIWHYCELQMLIHQSAGDYILKIDGQEVMSDTGIDTQDSATNDYVDRLELIGNGTQDTQYDDIYFLDTVGSDNTDFLGEIRIETVFPDALGNENDFTASPAVDQHLNVDDGATADDDTTYNHSATATDRELYGFAALQGSINTVFAVQAMMLVRKEAAGFREVRVIARSNVTEVEGSSEALATSYTYKSVIYENDPDGGGDWDEAAVNAAQFGLDLHT